MAVVVGLCAVSARLEKHDCNDDCRHSNADDEDYAEKCRLACVTAFTKIFIGGFVEEALTCGFINDVIAHVFSGEILSCHKTENNVFVETCLHKEFVAVKPQKFHCPTGFCVNGVHAKGDGDTLFQKKVLRQCVFISHSVVCLGEFLKV